MSGIIAVYGLVIAVLIAGDIGPPSAGSYALFTGFMHLACGLSVGFSGLAAGYAIGVVGENVRIILQDFGVLAVADFIRACGHICNSRGCLWAWYLY